MVTSPVDYLKEISIIKQLKELCTRLTGLNFEFFSINAMPGEFSCALKEQKAKNCKYHSRNCNQIRADMLDDCVSNKLTNNFSCPAGMSKIIIPLFLKDSVVGILFIGENTCAQFDKMKLDVLAKISYYATNYILENELFSLRSYKGNLMTHPQSMLQKVMRYIWENSERSDLTLKETARDNGVSYFYLSHLFKAHLKISFVEYRKQVKMDKAAKLLKNFDLSVSQIAYSCGFADASYFCKSFKKTHHCSPGVFRKNILSRCCKTKNEMFNMGRSFKNTGGSSDTEALFRRDNPVVTAARY